MQNEQFSEEYYKMKYFKYKAKYEQLKEQQGSSNMLSKAKDFFTKKTPAPGQVSGPVPGQVPQGPVPEKKQKKSFFSGITGNTAEKASDAKNLMNDVVTFVTNGMVDGKQKWKIIAKLEQPCTYQQIYDIVNNTQIITSGRDFETVKSEQETKARLLKDIKKTCSTITGGLNAVCKYVEPLAGGYGDSPNSLDDITLTDF